MKKITRILALSLLVIVGLFAALTFALPSNEFRISFPLSGTEKIVPGALGDPGSLAAPVLAATAGAGSITISWQQVAGANGYELHVRHDALPWQRLDDGSLTGSSTSYTHTDLTTGTTYYYTGRAVPASGKKSPWAPQAEATVTDAPAAPTLTANATTGQIELTWSGVTGADSYHLITWTEGQTEWQRIGDPLTGNNASYTHSELTAAQTYHYQVRAVIDGIEGAWSDTITEVPGGLAAPTLTATLAIGQVDLSWSEVTGADSYHLILWTEGQEQWERIGDPLSANASSYTHSELSAGKTYYYRVSAVINDTEGAWSNSISAVPGALAAPGLSATVASGQIELSWSSVTAADSYRLIFWTTGQEAWERIGDPLTANTTSYTHSELTAGQAYYYRVSAVINDIVGPWSKSVDVTP